MLNAERKGREGVSGNPGGTQTDPHPRVLPQAGPRGFFLVLALENLPHPHPRWPHCFALHWTEAVL